MRLVKSPLPVWGSLATRGGRLPAPLGCPKNEAKSAPNFFVRYHVVQDGGCEADGGDAEERREVMAKRKPNPRRVLRVCTQPDLAALIDRMERKQAIWVAGKVPDQWKNHLGKMPQFKPFAPKMQSFSGGIRLTEDIKASLHLQMSDVQAAVDIRQTLELSKLLVSVVIANDTKLKDFAPLLADILNALKFTQDKGTVTVEVTIEDSQIEKAFKSQP